MKGSKLAAIFILCALLSTGIACGSKSSSNSLPDLVVTEISLSINQNCWSSSYRCGTDVIVKNIGAGNAGPFAVILDGAQQNVSAGLAVGQETSLWFADHGCASGIRTATVDATAQVTESNESNNKLDMWLHEGTPPPPCPSPTPTPLANEVNTSDSGGQVNISVGELLIVKLDSNKTTGYSWNLSAISNTSVIKKVSDEYITPPATDPPLMGQGGYEQWTFQALAVGTANISMKYIRPWETEPAGNFSITVNVK